MTEANKSSQIRFIKKAEVLDRTQLSNSTLYKLMNSGEFPKNILLGEKAVVWAEHEIDSWMLGRMSSRNDG